MTTEFSFNRRGLLTVGAVAGALIGADATATTSTAQAATTESETMHGGCSTGSGTVVKTSAGRLRGERVRETDVFRGVPYGRSTAGQARFLPPEPEPGWEGVRDATEFGKSSPQVSPGIYWDPIIGEYFSGGRAQELIDADLTTGEDCLVLNVLTPCHRKGHSALPVMVYFHGGGYDNLSGSLAALADEFVARENVVLISVNHRLNAFGYMYLGELSPKYAAGNVALLDLVLALQWVQENVAAFGGDPTNVTIFGDSGGGGKVQSVMGMPQAAGLFHKAIIDSSVALNWQSRADATQAARNLLTKLKIESDDVDALLKVAPGDIVAALDGEPASRFGPVLDGVTVTEATWSDRAPEQVADVPLIVGSTAQELRQFSTGRPELFALTWDSLRSELLTSLQSTPEEVENVIAVFRAAEPEDDPSDVYFRVTAARSFGAWARRIATLKEAQPAAVYRYYFDYETPIYGGRLKSSHTMGVPLAMGLVYVPESRGLANQLQSTWATFARTGDPNNAALPRWSQYVTSGPTARGFTMVFDGESHGEDDFFADQLAALDEA